MDEKRFIQVILPLKLDWRPFYSVSQELIEEKSTSHPELFETSPSTRMEARSGRSLSIKRGTRVKVLFARRYYIGVVTDGNAMPPEHLNRILNISDIVTDLAPITTEELQFWDFLSEYYLCTIGEVYKSAYPGVKIKQEQIAARLQEREDARLEKAAELLDRKIARLQERVDKRQEALKTARKESRITLLQDEIHDLEIQMDKAQEEKAHLSGSSLLPSGREGDRAPSQIQDSSVLPTIQLSPAQQTAFEQIHKAFQNKKIALLNGVTGSGKTEIYIRLAQETLAKGKNVLYMVPEILMGNQLAHRLREVFGDRLLSFNSSQTTAERYRIAEKLQSDFHAQRHGYESETTQRAPQGYIVMGTRSALFLPHHDLGLVIIDEEHDTSYKQQDSNPRYNGRDAAIVLARIFHSNVLLGSATPSLESLYNCETGRYEEIFLTEKYYEAENAEVMVIDTIAERRKRGMKGLFSFKLIDQIHRTLAAGEQVVILRSRRAYSPVVQCDTCGDIPHCPHCNVTLSYHKAQERLVCHYCGYSEPFDAICHQHRTVTPPSDQQGQTSVPATSGQTGQECGGHLEPMGSGTQKVEEEARALFPEASIARLDSDTASSKTYLNRTLDDFYQGKIDLLIGTQIVAKGLDFPNLSLVVMLQADAMLGIEDFRADERALQLLEQFRGRCARRSQKGKFVIQTSQPMHPIYQQMLGTDAEGQNLIRTFLNERKLFNYPPYTRAINLILRDTNEARLKFLADQFYTYLCQCYQQQGQSTARMHADAAGPSPAQVAMPTFNLGGTQIGSVLIIPPYAPVIDKISNEYIRHMRISFKRDASLTQKKQLLRDLILRFEEEKKYAGHIAADVDPI